MKTGKAKHLKTRENIKIEAKEKNKKRFPVRKIIYISLACILAALLFYTGKIVYFSFLNPQAAFIKTVDAENLEMPFEAIPSSSADAVEASIQPSESPTPNEAPPETLSPEQAIFSKADLEFIKDKVNILLIGVDENPEREKTRVGFRSDVMLLLCIDFKQKNVHLLSIPRDSFAPIYNTKGRWKINAAFMHGGGFKGEGFLYCIKTVSNLLGGIPVNYYAGVQMDGMKKLIDALGGVDYDVDIPVKINGRYLKKGLQHLTGQQALDYCRIRKGIGTDINRVDRQQKFLLALFEQLKTQSKLALIPKVYKSLKNDFYTNMSFEQIIALAVFSMDLNMNQIKRHTLKGEYMIAYGTKFYVLDQSAKVNVVKEILNVTIKPDKKYDLNYIKGDSASNAAIKKAKSLLSKYKGKITADQKTRINSLISKAQSQRSQSAASKLLSECTKVEQEINNAA